MGLLQRLSLINKQWPKTTTKAPTTKSPSSKRSVSTSSTEESSLKMAQSFGNPDAAITSIQPSPSLYRSAGASPLAAATSSIDTPIKILITGGSQVDRSAVIRRAFDDVRPVRLKHKDGHAVQTKLTVDDTTYDLELCKMDTVNVIKSQELPEHVYNDFWQFDGVIVCYGPSSDNFDDLLNALTRWKRPIFLVRLNTDMTQCTMENQLAATFKTPSVVIDIHTSKDEMQKVYSALVQEILSPSTTNWISNQISSMDHEAARLPRSPHRYDSLFLASLDDNTPVLQDPRTGYLTPPLSPIQPIPTLVPGPPLTSSNHPGYSVADIVNELTFWDYHDQDTSTTIFLTFYRKFMTPYQLLQSLIERFEQDYECNPQPTRIQERIRTILSLWLSHQWGDFYHGRSYHTLHRFLQRLGNNPDLSAMYHLLAPLITRPGPMSDPDTMWGLTDDETDDISIDNSHSFYGLWANSPSITTMLSMSFSIDDDISDRHLSSAASLDWYKEANTPNLATLSCRSSNSSRPTLSATSSVYSQDTTLKSNGSRNDKNTMHPSPKRGHTDEPAVFGGGIMLMESTGRRPFSLTRLQSSLRHKSHNRYAMLMNIPVDLLAEQLTWAELTLYRNIKPRDYIRHLWGEKGASEAMMASISHGNFVRGWVVTMILIQSHHGKRIALLNKFIDLAYRLYQDHHNYNTLAAMLEGLNQVLDKHAGWIDPEKANQLDQLVTLMQTDSLYRQDLGVSNDGCSIPYLRVHRQDIVTIAETQRDVTIGGGVHWEKFKTMGEIILQLTRAGSLTTTTQPNPFVLAFISDTSLLTEKERICRLDDLREKY